MARIDFTRGFHFRGGDTPSFGLDRDVALYRVWFSGSSVFPTILCLEQGVFLNWKPLKEYV